MKDAGALLFALFSSGFGLVGLCARAMADTPPPALFIAEASRLINAELRFKEATDMLERVLGDPRITREERIESYRLLGIAFVALGATDSAEAAFGALLEIEASFELDPLLSPKIHDVFERVRSRVATTPRIADVTVIPDGERIVFSGRIEDPSSRVVVVELFTRIGGTEFERRTMEMSGDRLTAALDPGRSADDLAGDEARPTWVRIEYHIVGRSAEGAPIVRVADAENPSSVVVTRAPGPPASPAVQATLPPASAIRTAEPSLPRTPWYGEWWIWLIAAGVIGGGAVAALVFTSGGDGAPMGTLDPIRLE